ncbi:hypothetical protein BJV78DRAFT_765187 [Lactifluus subvellereus]|nr:hypothetical protein BJV78DRAFT_765187 [Lactifluus subvellereus]
MDATCVHLGFVQPASASLLPATPLASSVGTGAGTLVRVASGHLVSPFTPGSTNHLERQRVGMYRRRRSSWRRAKRTPTAYLRARWLLACLAVQTRSSRVSPSCPHHRFLTVLFVRRRARLSLRRHPMTPLNLLPYKTIATWSHPIVRSLACLQDRNSLLYLQASDRSHSKSTTAVTVVISVGI